jgi:hypothetical protein
MEMVRIPSPHLHDPPTTDSLLPSIARKIDENLGSTEPFALGNGHLRDASLVGKWSLTGPIRI